MNNNIAKIPLMGIIGLIAAFQSFIALFMGVDTPLAIVKMGASPTILGLAYSAWAIGRAGTGILAGYWFDRHGAKASLLLSFILLAIVAFGYGLLWGPWSMVVLRLLQGASAGIYWTSALALIGYQVSPKNRARRMALFNACVAVGGMAGGLAGGWMVASWGFRLPFWVASILGLMTAVLVKVSVPGRHVAPVKVAPSPVPAQNLWPLSIVGGLSQLPSFLSNAALPLELLRFHLGAWALGLENAGLVLGNLIGQWSIFRYPTVIYRRIPVMFLYFLGIIAALGTVRASNGWEMMAFLAVVGTMVNLYAVVWTAAVQQRDRANDTGRATGILRTTGDAMSAASYPLIGWVEADAAATGIAAAGVLILGLCYVACFYQRSVISNVSHST